MSQEHSEQIGQIKAPAMPIPSTAELQPWTSFPPMEYQFIDQQFPHENKFAIKGHLSHMRGGVEVQQQINQTKTGAHLGSQYKVWLDLQDKRSLYARLRTNNIKLHFDNGCRKILGKDFNFYTTLSSSNTFTNLSWRLGLLHNSEHCHADCRVKLVPHQGVSFSLRNIYKNGKFTYGFVGMVDLNNHIFTLGNLLLGYKVDQKTNVFVRSEQEHFRRKNPEGLKGWFDNILIDAVTRYNNKTTFAAQLALQQKSHAFKWTQFVFQQKHKNDKVSKLKLKLSNNSVQCSASTLFPLSSTNGSISLGIHAINPHKENRLFQWGTLLQFNI